jgi:hypothetical protein
VKFSTITVPPGNFITTSLNLELSGVTSSGFSPGASGKAGGSVNISFTLFNPITDAAPTAGQGTLSFGSNGSSKSGLLSAFLADGTKQTVKTDTFTVPLDTPLTLSVELQTNASAVLTGGGLASAAADFANTLSFPKSGPVFNLSGGATANSVDGGISSNQFTGVPEPGAAGLLILAAAAALGRRCRMRKI